MGAMTGPAEGPSMGGTPTYMPAKMPWMLGEGGAAAMPGAMAGAKPGAIAGADPPFPCPR